MGMYWLLRIGRVVMRRILKKLLQMESSPKHPHIPPEACDRYPMLVNPNHHATKLRFCDCGHVPRIGSLFDTHITRTTVSWGLFPAPSSGFNRKEGFGLRI